MIHTIEELITVISDCKKRMDINQDQINQAVIQKKLEKQDCLKRKENSIKKQIQNHILYFKNKIANNHLATKLFGSRLAVLEKQYQLQTQINNGMLFCLKVLKEKHLVIKNDQAFFSKMGQSSEALLCQEELQMIETQSESLLQEFYKKISKSTDGLDKEMKIQLNELLHYYGWDFISVNAVLEKKEAELELHLEKLKINLKSITLFFNCHKKKQIELEMEQVDEELATIKSNIATNTNFFYELFNKVEIK